jgi:hypothetical protein
MAEKTLLRQRLFLRFALLSLYAADPLRKTDSHVAILEGANNHQKGRRCWFSGCSVSTGPQPNRHAW